MLLKADVVLIVLLANALNINHIQFLTDYYTICSKPFVFKYFLVILDHI